ncbi:unnamed protein product [Dibothriocephalus latus]|uniref:Tyrosine-protein phosphatase domain-containing protein n=1 Tax=Dibothriocephalus latus TaxID=60516 RepID=A0A3P7M534_DIBLA|nr:unnamed protein product [Dibothriocephalus latus]
MCISLPDDQNIVRLDRDWSTYCGDQQPIGPLMSEMPAVYVNANYVKACCYDALGRAQVASKTSLPEYIATQGPLTHTVADFLYMVHQQRSPVVIMLCNTIEGGKPKCAQYWPDAKGLAEEERSLARTVTVTLHETITSPFMVTRVLTVQPEGTAELIFSAAGKTRCAPGLAVSYIFHCYSIVPPLLPASRVLLVVVAVDLLWLPAWRFVLCCFSFLADPK